MSAPVDFSSLSDDALVSFKMTQDILDQPQCYQDLVRVPEKQGDKLQCPISLEDFKNGDLVLGRKQCKHHCLESELKPYLQRHSSPTRKFGNLVTLPLECPLCRGYIGSITNITTLTEQQVAEMREIPESSKDETEEVKVDQKEPSQEKILTTCFNKQKLYQIVKIAAIVVISTSYIFLLFSQNKISITIQVN